MLLYYECTNQSAIDKTNKVTSCLECSEEEININSMNDKRKMSLRCREHLNDIFLCKKKNNNKKQTYLFNCGSVFGHHLVHIFFRLFLLCLDISEFSQRSHVTGFRLQTKAEV